MRFLKTTEVTDLDAVKMADQDRVMASPWGGGRSPFASHHGKIGMWLFLASDTLTFSGLLIVYLLVRGSSPTWPNVLSEGIFSLELVTVMTTILIASSASMAMAVDYAKQENLEKMRRFLFLTITGGVVFLGMQVYEWTHFIQAGATLTSNPFGPPMFGGAFFVITGVHGLHILSGVIYLLVLGIKALRGAFRPDQIESAGLYWHFVDLVWVLVFTLFYLV